MCCSWLLLCMLLDGDLSRVCDGYWWWCVVVVIKGDGYCVVWWGCVGIVMVIG